MNTNTPQMNSTNDARNTQTQHGTGTSSKIKGAISVVHGIGDSIRGQVMGAIDDSPANREIANKGRLETEQGMDAFHKHPVSTNNRLSGYNDSVGNGAAGVQHLPQTEPTALHQSENVPTHQNQQSKLEPQRYQPGDQQMTSSDQTNGSAGYPPPPPHTNGGAPMANQEELLAAKAERRQMSPQLGLEIPAMHQESSAWQPPSNAQQQGFHQQQHHQMNPVQAPPTSQGENPLQQTVPHHHRDDAVMNADPNAPPLPGGPPAGGPHISTQDKLDGTVNPPSYQENQGFSMGNVKPGEFVPGTGPSGGRV